MELTEKDVLRVADLANLELTDQERARMLQDLSSILGYIDRLNELNTADVPPMAQSAGDSKPGSPAAGALRDDEPRPSLEHSDALKNAPDKDDSFFKVPKVIEK